MNDSGITSAFLSFRRRLFGLVRRIVDDPVEVEDIVHEAYLRSLAASRKQAIDAPKAFIARTARNLALNHIVSASVRLTDSLGDYEPVDPRYSEAGIEDYVDCAQQFHQFCRAVEDLPVKCRRVFTLKLVYGLSQKEIAGRLKISEKTVEYHVSQGLLKCRRYLARESQNYEVADSHVGSTGIRG